MPSIANPEPRYIAIANTWKRARYAREKAIACRQQRRTNPAPSALATLASHDFHRRFCR